MLTLKWTPDELVRCDQRPAGQDVAAFWTEKVEIQHDPDVARIDGQHYIVADADGNRTGGPHGFDGRTFTLRFRGGGGRIVVTRDLWHQGEIPGDYRAQLPDTAVFDGEGPLPTDAPLTHYAEVQGRLLARVVIEHPERPATP
jgi:hypothetical protein